MPAKLKATIEHIYEILKLSDSEERNKVQKKILKKSLFNCLAKKKTLIMTKER